MSSLLTQLQALVEFKSFSRRCHIDKLIFMIFCCSSELSGWLNRKSNSFRLLPSLEVTIVQVSRCDFGRSIALTFVKTTEIRRLLGRVMHSFRLGLLEPKTCPVQVFSWQTTGNTILIHYALFVLKKVNWKFAFIDFYQIELGFRLAETMSVIVPIDVGHPAWSEIRRLPSGSTLIAPYRTLLGIHLQLILQQKSIHTLSNIQTQSQPFIHFCKQEKLSQVYLLVKQGHPILDRAANDVNCINIDSIIVIRVCLGYVGGSDDNMIEYSQRVVVQARKTKGYLLKKSTGFISSWQKRFFIILDNALNYFPDETLEPPPKTISLAQIRYIKLCGSTELQLVTTKRVYELRAQDEASRDLWAASLDILINYKQANTAISQPKTSLPRVTLNPPSRINLTKAQASTNRHNSSAKQQPTKRQSKHKKLSHRFQSSASLRSNSSSTSPVHPKLDYSPQNFLSMICLHKLSSGWKQANIKNKIILMKQAAGCYFVISCKTLLTSSEDQDFLSQDLITPYEFNTLYYFAFETTGSRQVVEIGKCCDFQQVSAANAKTVGITFKNKTVSIELQHKKMQLIDVYAVVRKLKSSMQIGKQYHNQLGIKLKRNCDMILKLYLKEDLTIQQIVNKQLQKYMNQGKEGHVKVSFRKNMQNMKKSLREIVNCCEVKQPSAMQFKNQFVLHFNQCIYDYVHKMWGSLNKGFTLIELKKISILLFDLSKLVKSHIKDNRLYEGSIQIQKFLMQKYQQQIMTKMDSCFDLAQAQILDQVNIQVKSEENNKSEVSSFFFSNTIFRQFSLDINLLLHQLPQMPIYQNSFICYSHLFLKTFKHISEKTFKNLDKWKDSSLILGTCNQIQLIKNILFEQMSKILAKLYAELTPNMNKQLIKDLQSEISNIQIMLIKKLFVLTFSDIDRQILGKSYQQFDIGLVCRQIIQKLLKFTKINKYVKKNILQASFQQICYFYYTILIKHSPSKSSLESFIGKLVQDIKTIGGCFEKYIDQDKIYTHLKDLHLIKEFLQCDLSQIKKMCAHLKKQYGNSFTQSAVRNLLSHREINNQLRQDLLNECSQIVKSSADTPEQISLISSSRQSFKSNWNHRRSRKSTLTLSLNEFYENQQILRKNKHKVKQGYLLRKKLNKNVQTSEQRGYFKISNGQFQQYESENTKQQPVNVFELHSARKCYLHPEKGYIFIIQFPQNRLQLKAETTQEAKEWIKNIYEEISSLSVTKEARGDKPSQQSMYFQSLKTDTKEGSTMEHSPLINKNSRSKQKRSPSVKSPKKLKKKDRQIPVGSAETNKKKQQQKQDSNDNCIQCSKGFFL